MNNSKSNGNIKSVPQLKQKLSYVYRNINELEDLTKHNINIGTIECEKLFCVNTLLQQLEEAPLENIKKKLYKRKRQRKKRSVSSSKPSISHYDFKVNTTESVRTQSNHCNKTQTTNPKTLKPHVKLSKRYNAKRFVRTFDLLIKLFETRSQNVELTNKFKAQLECINSKWQKILLENSCSVFQCISEFRLLFACRLCLTHQRKK